MRLNPHLFSLSRTFESLNYFQKVLVNGGVIDALREHGCTDGDTVSIYDIEFDFTD